MIRGRPANGWVLVICVAMQFLVVATGIAEKPTSVSGGGGFPLTASVTSMWGTVDEATTPGTKRLSFLIYFRGAEGWHDRKWEFNLQVHAEPFVHEFKCDLTTLRAEVDRASRTLTVFGSHVDLMKANVILVDHVDRPGEEVVTILGKFDLAIPEDSNPAAWALQQNQELMSTVFGDPLPTNEVLDFRDILAGAWGWEVEGAACVDNPHTIEFSSSRKKMTLRYAKGLDGNPPTVAVYKIIGEEPGFIRMKMKGENRKTEEGEPVVWDLVLLDANSYCWHRTDWSPGGCTQPVKRCVEPQD